MRQLPGRGGVPARTAASGAASSRILTAGTYRINPALFDVVTAADARRARHDADGAARLPDAAGSGRHRHGARRPPDPGGRSRRARPCAATTASSAAQAFIDAGGCRGLQEQVLLSGSWNLNPWFVQRRAGADDRDPDRLRRRGRQLRRQRARRRLAATRFTHGDLVERGRKGVWVEPLLPGQAPAQHARHEGRAGADDQHRAQLGAAHRGAPLRRSGCRRSPCARRTASRSASTCRRSSTSACRTRRG